MNKEFIKKPILSFFQELNESRLIPSKSHISSYNLRDIADAVFLYFIVLYILKHEFSYAAIEKKYAYRTYANGHFNDFSSAATDLHVLIVLLLGQNKEIEKHLSEQKANHVLRLRLNIDETKIKRLLQSLD